jgi:hypothetical protein
VTRDPISGEELIATRLESPAGGIVIEGAFSFGWLARLSQEQIDFVGVFLRHRGNLKDLAPELDISYNTARNRLEEISVALGGAGAPEPPPDRRQVLVDLNEGRLTFDEAMELIRKG